MVRSLAGKVAVVTGGSRGIGNAIARRLVSEGADVLISAREPDALADAAAALEGLGESRVMTAACDLATVEGCERLHDIATDAESPAQREAYPDIRPILMKDGREKAFARALASAAAMGWEIVGREPAAGRFEAVATTPWFGFKDDVAVRVAEVPGGSRIDVRSKSRVGRGDAGTNAKRIREFRAKLLE